jgi:hypothetical protein
MTTADDLRPLLPAHWRPTQTAAFVESHLYQKIVSACS